MCDIFLTLILSINSWCISESSQAKIMFFRASVEMQDAVAQMHAVQTEQQRAEKAKQDAMKEVCVTLLVYRSCTLIVIVLSMRADKNILACETHALKHHAGGVSFLGMVLIMLQFCPFARRSALLNAHYVIGAWGCISVSG